MPNLVKNFRVEVGFLWGEPPSTQLELKNTPRDMGLKLTDHNNLELKSKLEYLLLKSNENLFIKNAFCFVIIKRSKFFVVHPVA